MEEKIWNSRKKLYEIPKFQIVREKIGIPKKFPIKFQKNGGRKACLFFLPV